MIKSFRWERFCWTSQFPNKQLREAGEELYGDMVKAVVDVKEGIIAAGGELHADDEAFLLERNSLQENLWGDQFVYNAGSA